MVVLGQGMSDPQNPGGGGGGSVLKNEWTRTGRDGWVVVGQGTRAEQDITKVGSGAGIQRLVVLDQGMNEWCWDPGFVVLCQK